MRGKWRYPVAAVVAAHGLIHIMGFAAAWRLASGTVSSTPSFGGQPGSPFVLVLGAAWALVALTFLTSASGLVMRNSWWPRVTQGAALASLILCALWWRDASFGIGIDVVIILILAWMHGRPRHLAEGRADAA